MTGAFSWAATKVTTGFDLVDLTPDQSYMRERINAVDATYGSEGNLATMLYGEALGKGRSWGGQG